MSSPERAVQDPSAAPLPKGVAGAFILLLCLILPFIMFAVTYEVVARHFFGLVPLWVNDVTGWLLLALTFLGGAFVMAKDGHTQVDIVVEHTSEGIRRNLTWVNTVLVLAICLVLTAAAAYTTWDSYVRKVSVTGIVEAPRWLIIAPICIGCALLCIERVQRLRELWRGRKGATPST